jgi:hypothetical protein
MVLLSLYTRVRIPRALPVNIRTVGDWQEWLEDLTDKG